MHRIFFHGDRHIKLLTVLKDNFHHNRLPHNISRTLTFDSICRIKSNRSFPRIIPYQSLRKLFIQTNTTPNVDALKFIPHHSVLPQGVASPSLEYLSPRSTIAGPNPSPLAGRLLSIDGITSVFYGRDFITVTKAADANWSHLKPEVFSLISEAFTSGEEIVHITEGLSSATPDNESLDTLAYSDNDSEVVGLIRELLDTRIRPAIQDDGGDIEFRGFKDGNVLLKLRGACRTCDSSTVTLRNGIETMLKHYIDEVKGVIQVLDPEEEISIKEFENFEKKLKDSQ